MICPWAYNVGMIEQIDLNPSCNFLEAPLSGETIKLRSWGQFQGAQGVALLVHGLGAHSAWFEAEARELAKRGFFVLAYDHCGFGNRRRRPFKSYKQWIDDLAAVLAFVSAKFTGLPLYLMGNSMGALVVMATSQIVKVSGIVIFSPGFDGHPKAFTPAYKISSVLSAIFAPQRPVSLPYGFELVSRDSSVREWLEKDEEKRVAVPGSMLFELLKLSQHVLANLKATAVPVLMITAGQDRIVNNELNGKLFARLNAPSKKHVHLPEAWHDLMFDPQLDEVADEISLWHSELGKPCTLIRQS
ncbi:MAG: lysophospholipase [Candidatus Obscuribacterales bacterium]|nr:lysophospholipase [Candidatus Obscuribacterales bacterium]